MYKSFQNLFLVFAIIFPGLSCFAEEYVSAEKNPEEEYVSAEKNREEVTFLLSQISSGNTWCRYCIEYLTKRPTLQHFDHATKANLPIGLIYQDFNIDLSKPPVWKCHDQQYIDAVYSKIDKKINKSRDKLIFLLRDYKECMTKLFVEPNRIREELMHENCSYFTNIYTYDSWDVDKRILIHYTDLLLNPRQELIRIARFLGVENFDIDEFMENLEFHRMRCIKLYRDNFFGSESLDKGYSEESLKYHQKKLPEVFWAEIDRLVADRHPSLVEKYLGRYMEKSEAIGGFFRDKR